MKRFNVRIGKNQQGFALISILFAIAIMATLIGVGARYATRYTLQKRAEIEGEALGQYAVGLRGFVAAAQANSSLIPSSAKTGVDWLKGPSCGGLSTNPTAGYVPCGFTGGTFGSAYSTSFTYTSSTNAIEARTNFLITNLGYSTDNASLMADRVVETATAQQSLPNNGTFYAAYANVAASATAVASSTAIYAPGTNAGRVVMVVNNAPSNDIWLRTDGTNKMLANLNMGGFSIDNAKDGVFTGNVEVDGGMSVGDGLTVTSGTADLKGGLITTDAAYTDIGAYATQAIYTAQVLTGAASYTVTKPTCPSSASTASIFTAFQGTGAAGSVGDALYEARIDVTSDSTSWTVKPVLVGTKFTMSLSGLDLTFTKASTTTNPTDARIIVLKKCS